jgi:UDP-2,3-diacylglucosamine pyrophosphatase LpxH
LACSDAIHIAELSVVSSSANESLLILSDVHLGNDLNDLSAAGGRRSSLVDDDLANLLAHYRRSPCTGKGWRLVIAGDFIDFVGMSILPAAPCEASAEEREHGLGNGADHATLKLRAVAERHFVVFQALADFVAAGHGLTIVHGNHDVEFHWDKVKDAFRQLLVEIAVLRNGWLEAPTSRDFASRIEFAPWFYYVGGVAYVEHGHQYDTLCSTDHVMAPLSPRDPRRIARSLSDVLLRWVVRPTGSVPEYGHERMGVIDYVMLGVSLGFGGVARLGMRFAGAVVELFRLRRAHWSVAAQSLREEHERRMAALADRTRIGIERLRSLAALQVPPVTRSIRKIMASVLLDRIALGAGAMMIMVPLAVVAGFHPWAWSFVAAVLGGWALTHRRLTAQRREWFGEKLDNDEILVERAGHLARLFPAAFVVMGHTHTPVMKPVAEGTATYVNVGSWHEAERTGKGGREDDFRAARTHLVIHPNESGPRAEFLAWGAEGPRLFVAKRAPARET